MRYAVLILFIALAPVLGQDNAKSYPPIPAAVSSLGAIASDGYLYVYGGHAGKTHSYDTKSVLGTFHRLKLDDGTKWEELSGGPILQGMNLAAHGGTIYRVGGMSPRNAPGEKSDNVSLVASEKFDPKVGKWQSLPDLPAGRSSHDLVVVGDKLIVVGGWQMNGKDGKSQWHDTALSLDLAKPGVKWESIPQPFQRRALTAAALGGKVYVLGGLTTEGKSVRKNDVLDVATGKWSTGPDIPGDDRVGFSPATTIVGDRIVLSTSDTRVYRLVADGSEWEKVGTAGGKRMVHRAVSLGKDSVLLVGGAGGKDGNHAELEIIKLAAKGEKVATQP